MKKFYIYLLAVMSALAMKSCRDKAEEIQWRDVNATFTTYNFDNIRPSNIIMLAAPNDVRHVYLIPGPVWTNLNSEDISDVIRYGLKPALAASKKARGNGRDGFQFERGMVSRVDSTWLSNNGWPVNQ